VHELEAAQCVPSAEPTVPELIKLLWRTVRVRAAPLLVPVVIACVACIPARTERAAGQASAALTSCALDGVPGPARCGAIQVPEDPARPLGRQLAIHFAVLPATGGKALPDPIVPLLGGPGEAAIGDAAMYAERFAALRDQRDLLLVDQRGTGRSAPLQCDLHAGVDVATSLQHLFPSAGARRCLQAMSARTDLRQYTYAHSARDLEQVRRALGYGPLNLSAGSYGTRAAQVYMRAYPGSVRPTSAAWYPWTWPLR
jgi:pimeloyl-ACP methyl ester carboxylesterase